MAAPALDFRNVNSLWGSVAAETLARCAVRHAVISPGSRSTPLTIALASHPEIEAIPVLDERSAAFLALGLAKCTETPVVLLCTSGSAGANYFPAVIEAHESGVPLIVITADRPPEMRECASGQTIDQQKLFGAHVSFYHELAVAEASLSLLGYLRQTLAHAVDRARGPVPGPVHLNAPFRDPLPPIEDAQAKALAGKIDADFFSHLGAPTPVVTRSTLWQRPTTARGIIVAGPLPATKDAAEWVKKVRELSDALGWPVLADGLSPLRADSQAITSYDVILRNADAARELTPRTVLCIGGWPTSKVLRGWLEASAAEILLVSQHAANRDALHGRTRQITAPLDSISVSGERIHDESYLAAWRAREQAARGAIESALEKETALVEPKASWLLTRVLPTGTPLVVANSMPVRDLEYFRAAGGPAIEVFFSRGANGIDGTLSTALGVAHAADKPAVLLTGDLALLHDSNGFLAVPQLRGALTIVLINNQGGGIFEHLPVAQFEPPFEKFFATPQQVDFATLCAAHRVEHVVVKDWIHFETLLRAEFTRGVRVLEVRTDRKHDAAWRKRLFAQVAAKLN